VNNVRVLIGDRSLTVRNLLRRLLEDETGISVAGDSCDGEELLGLVRETEADALVLDLDLPALGGLELADAIGRHKRIPLVVLTSRRESDRVLEAFRAHSLGVAAVLPKPEVPDEWSNLGGILGETIRQLGIRREGAVRSKFETDDTPTLTRGLRYVAVGASTGGPAAVFDLLQSMAPDFSVGVILVQHIAEGFESTYSEWLATELGIDVKVARDGERLTAGKIRVAPPGNHLTLGRDGMLNLDRHSDPVNGHRPAVETLFRSLLEHPPSQVAAVLLSGLGSDGAEGMVELREANILTIAQEETSCAVFGMPRAAIERRGAALALAPGEIGCLLARAAR
jgi:two-component system chemotaxis response regulator CheB